MLDEREVSWKVLLPSNKDTKVLVFGLYPAAIAGLARTWDRVFWINPQGTKLETINIPAELSNRVTVVCEQGIKNTSYDIIIAGGSVTPKLEELSGLLVEDGILVCIGFLGCLFTEKHLISAGFNSVGLYGALPTKGPRVFYPMADKKLRSLGLGFHNPGSLNARLGIQCAKNLSNLGIKFPLQKGSVILATRRKSIEGTLLEWLKFKLGREIIDLVIYCGSDSEKRKITALAIGKNNENYIVKFADTTNGSMAIAQETVALLTISNCELPAIIPEIIFEDKWNDYLVQVQTNLPRGGWRQAQKLTNMHLKLLAALTDINRQRCKLSTTHLWLDTMDFLSKRKGKMPRNLSLLVNEVSSPNYGEQEVITHHTHGDFAPWNINLRDGEIIIWDWEDSVGYGLFFLDIIHFIIRQAILIGPWPGGQKIIDLILLASGKLSALASIPCQMNPLAILKLWLLREYHLKPSEYLEEIASGLTGDNHA